MDFVSYMSHMINSFYSQRTYLTSELSGVGIVSSGKSANCIIAFATVSGSTITSALTDDYCQSLGDTKERYGICQYSECTAKDGKTCIFPFK